MARSRALGAGILLWAALLRLSGIGWDGWQQQHPDERFLAMVAAQLGWPSSIGEALDPARTPLNPNNRGSAFYVYGALPPEINRAATEVLGRPDVVGLLRVGRALAALADVATTLLVMLLAARLAGTRAGLLAGTLYASCPLMIQQSRFATADGWGTMLAALAVWLALGRSGRVRELLAAGVAAGLATACKPDLALVLVVPLGVVALRWWDEGRSAGQLLRRAGLAAAIAGAAVLALKIVDPGAFAGVLSVMPAPRRVDALRQLGAIVRGLGQYPPNLQWADRRPLLDPLANLLLWGTGPLLGVAVVAGLGRAVKCAAIGDRRWLAALAWVLPVATLHLFAFVASVRHFEALLPLLVVAAAAWLARRRRPVVALGAGATAVAGVLWASIAWQPYTRVEASRWMAANLAPGATVTAEYWDDALPLPGEGPPGARVVTMRVFDPDTSAKRELLLEALDATDAVVLSSQRGVGSICRVPSAYPVTSEYYHLLFSGALGFRLAAHFERRVGAGRLAISDLTAEESLSVYDHPPVWIFVKTPAYSSALARRLLYRVPPGPTAWVTRDLEARGRPPWEQRWRDHGALPGAFDAAAARQALDVALWVVWVELAGLLGVRLIRRVAPRLPDGGWGLARWGGMTALGLAWAWSGWVGVPGWNGWLPTVLTVAAAPFALKPLRAAWREPGYRAIALLTWVVFLVFAAIRAGNPEVYWGEKPMDAAILASIWRADRLPVLDPWLAGAPLDYYHFGFFPFALAARAMGVGPGVAFNLIAATVPALAVGCAATAGWLLSGRRTGAWLAALLAQLSGTAAAVLHPAFLLRPGFDGFWATSRVIPDTINEYPVWTALFADLHAHFFGFAGFLAAVALISALALRGLRRGGAGLLGAVIGVEAITNTWELPVLVTLLGAALLYRRGTRCRAAMLDAWGHAARALAAGVACTAPFWLTTRSAAAGVGWTHAAPARAAALLELFGVPAGVAIVAFVASMLVAGRDRFRAWSWLLIGAGLGAVLLPEVITVADRMNTVFKMHLQAHLLLAVGLAGVLVRTVAELPPRRARAAVAAVAAVVAAGVCTSVADARAVLRTVRVPGPRPTLDGNAYLSVAMPRQAEVLGRLAGVRYAGAVAEPLGSPYSDTLRVPMFAGAPAVVGWPYHLWQRRHDWSELALRQSDLASLLEGEDDALVKALARRYRLTGAVSWDGHPPAVARVLGWPALPLRQGAGLFLAPAGDP